MAVVAVLLIHMERNAVVSMKPSIKLQRTIDQSNISIYIVFTGYPISNSGGHHFLPSINCLRNPRNFRLWNPETGKICLWNPESWALESGIQLKESRIPLTIEIQNPSSTDKNWNPVPGIRNPSCGIQNPRLSRIRLHGARTPSYCFKRYPEVNFTWVIYDAILPSVKRSQCYRVNTLPFLKLTDISSCA